MKAALNRVAWKLAEACLLLISVGLLGAPLAVEILLSVAPAFLLAELGFDDAAIIFLLAAFPLLLVIHLRVGVPFLFPPIKAAVKELQKVMSEIDLQVWKRTLQSDELREPHPPQRDQ